MLRELTALLEYDISESGGREQAAMNRWLSIRFHETAPSCPKRNRYAAIAIRELCACLQERAREHTQLGWLRGVEADGTNRSFSHLTRIHWRCCRTSDSRAAESLCIACALH